MPVLSPARSSSTLTSIAPVTRGGKGGRTSPSLQPPDYPPDLASSVSTFCAVSVRLRSEGIFASQRESSLRRKPRGSSSSGRLVNRRERPLVDDDEPSTDRPRVSTATLERQLADLDSHGDGRNLRQPWLDARMDALDPHPDERDYAKKAFVSRGQRRSRFELTASRLVGAPGIIVIQSVPTRRTS